MIFHSSFGMRVFYIYPSCRQKKVFLAHSPRMEHLQYFIRMQTQPTNKNEFKAHVLKHKEELAPVINNGIVRFDAPHLTYLPAIYSVCCCTLHDDSCELLSFMLQEFPDIDLRDMIIPCLFKGNYGIARMLARQPGFDVSEIINIQTQVPQDVLEYIFAVADPIDEMKPILYNLQWPDDHIQRKHLEDPDGIRQQLRIKYRIPDKQLSTRIYCLKLFIDLKFLNVMK